MSAAAEAERVEKKRIEKIKAAAATFVSKFEEWKSKRKNVPWKYIVGVDVGATNIRTSFLFISAEGEEKYFECAKVRCSCTKKLVQYMNIIKNEIVATIIAGQAAEAAVLAVAGPVEAHGLHVEITNYKGGKNLSVEDLPVELFPPQKTKFINDLEACCYGILYLNHDSKLQEYFAPAFSPSNNEIASDSKTPLKLQNNHYLVMAMGTGLGTGLLFSSTYKLYKFDNAPKFEVIPLEAGHCSITYPAEAQQNYQKESKRLSVLSKNVYESASVPEFEDICSGRGLRACYAYETGQDLDAAEISKRAAEREPAAVKAMLAHYEYLMIAAQNVCVMIPSCKGIFFAGDNQVANDPFVRSHVKELHSAFLQHPKKAWLDAIVAYRQVKSMNLNIAGTFYYIKTNFLTNEASKL